MYTLHLFFTVWPEHKTSTTTASKYVHTQKAKNLHHLKSPFQTQIYLVNVPLNVNIVKQDLLYKKTVFEIFMSIDRCTSFLLVPS